MFRRQECQNLVINVKQGEEKRQILGRLKVVVLGYMGKCGVSIDKVCRGRSIFGRVGYDDDFFLKYLVGGI